VLHHVSRAVAVLALSGCLLAACGEEGAREATGEERLRINTVVQAYLSSPGGDSCGLLTEGFVEKLTGEKGAAALRRCRAQPRDSARNLELQTPVVVGDRALVSTDRDGVRGVVSLMRSDDDWKISDITYPKLPAAPSTRTQPPPTTGQAPRTQTQPPRTPAHAKPG